MELYEQSYSYFYFEDKAVSLCMLPVNHAPAHSVKMSKGNNCTICQFESSTGANSPSSLAGALGEYEDGPQKWYDAPARRPQWMEIPQETYMPPPKTIFTVQNDIRFVTPEATGIALSAALEGRCPDSWEWEHMDNLSSSSTKITLRINWPGYRKFSQPINVRDDTFERKPITKKKLLQNLAKVIRAFLELFARYHSTSSKWKIGTRVSAENLIISKLTHVSSGSWQPVLYLKSEEAV